MGDAQTKDARINTSPRIPQKLVKNVVMSATLVVQKMYVLLALVGSFYMGQLVW